MNLSIGGVCVYLSLGTFVLIGGKLVRSLWRLGSESHY